MLATLKRFKRVTGSFIEWYESMWFLIWLSQRKLYWMIWVHVLFNLAIVALKTAIDTNYWNFKKWFCIQCDNVSSKKVSMMLSQNFINVLMEACTHFHLANFVIFSSCIMDIGTVVFTCILVKTSLREVATGLLTFLEFLVMKCNITPVTWKKPSNSTFCS